MIRIDLARAMAERMDITLKDADTFLTIFMDVVGETLEKGEKIQLAGFGGFVLRYVPEHQGRNPKTGEVLTVPACHYPIFKAGKSLREKAAKYNQVIEEGKSGSKNPAKTATTASSTKSPRKKKMPPQEESKY